MVDLVEAEAAQLAFRKSIPGRMSKFKLTELSGCDRPAQAGATVAFLKREDGIPPAAVEPDPVIRKAAVLAGVEALAKARAADSGVSYERAYSDLILGSPELAAAVV
jgi:hypothetical protein